MFTINFKRRKIHLHLGLALLQFFKNELSCPRNNACRFRKLDFVSFSIDLENSFIALHREGLAGTSLAIGENTGVFTVNSGLNEGLHLGEKLPLSQFRGENLIEVKFVL